MIDSTWSPFFIAEIRSSGRKLFVSQKVSISSASDTEIHAYVRASPPVKVLFHSDSAGSPSFVAGCSCPMGKKRQFCKHVWATLLATDADHPDYLATRRSIEKPSEAPEPAPDAREDAQASWQETAKARAAEYRKDQYQRQKERKKAEKGKSSKLSTRTLSPEVEEALAYFDANGFAMPEGPDEEILGEAKRKLSRVFHPDKGGSHEEIVELNRNYERLLRELR
jgi:hypothetical protein